MKTFIKLILLVLLVAGCNKEPQNNIQYGQTVTLNKEALSNKIKGGWAGQVIGVTYGGPTEFRYNGTIINDYNPIQWDNDMIEWWYDNAPGLYDDIYMDLTFVEVFDKHGLDASAEEHAKAFAYAKYPLWHANQAARYNIIHGIMPPESGHWTKNPHADDIDFQIEADFAGLMAPGMVNTASAICDKVGHIMNYGDGWYGGVYVASMYALAFVNDDVETIVKEGLKSIPQQSSFYQCINDVINWHALYPDDWKKTWWECQLKWSQDVGCPQGVFNAFNIDAKINAAYIVIGLLYGEGEFGKTMEISTRCGQDSDCNPASAGGILGVMLGYDKIPEYWMKGLKKVEDRDFKFTEISLNDVYDMGTKHAIETVKRNDGAVKENKIKIKIQKPESVKLEQGFKGHYPVDKISFGWGGRNLNKENKTYAFDFEGNGFVVKGGSRKNDQITKDTVVKVQVFVDDKLFEVAELPTKNLIRRHEITWKYQLKNQKHNVKLEFIGPEDDYHIWIDEVLIYSKPKQN